MKKEDLSKLQKLFWEYCKTFNEYEDFNEKKYTRKEILIDIEKDL